MRAASRSYCAWGGSGRCMPSHRQPRRCERCSSPASCCRQSCWTSPASARHLPDADQGATALARREISRFPHKERTHMLGSTTAPGRPGARDDAPVHVAFRSMHSVGVPGVLFSRLNTQPMRTPVNASPSPSRGPTHDSGTVWFATPSLEETCTLYSLPVSRRTHCQLKQGGVLLRSVARCEEFFCTPIGLPPSQPRGAGKLTSTPLS